MQFTLRKEKMELVKVDETVVSLPLDLVWFAHSPVDGAEDGHDDAAAKYHQPTRQQEVRDGYEDHAPWNIEYQTHTLICWMGLLRICLPILPDVRPNEDL